MAGYYLMTVKVVGRKSEYAGVKNSSLKAAAYISAEKYQKKRVVPLEAAAYISGKELISEDGSDSIDYRRKTGVVFSEVVLPVNAPERLRNPEVLWNEVEHVEKRANADLFREWICCFESSLSEQQRMDVARQFAQALADEGMAVHYALHDEKNHNGNFHAHFLAPTRGFTESGEWQPRKIKPRGYVLDEHGERIPVLDKKTGEQKRSRAGKLLWVQEPIVFVDSFNDRRKKNVPRWRQLWADLENQYLAPQHQVSPQSYLEQGLDKVPRQRVSKESYQVQKKLEAQIEALPLGEKQKYVHQILEQVKQEYRRLYYDTSRGNPQRAVFQQSEECKNLRSELRHRLFQQKKYSPPDRCVRTFSHSGRIKVEHALCKLLAYSQMQVDAASVQEDTAEIFMNLCNHLLQAQNDLLITFVYGLTKDIESRMVQQEYEMKKMLVKHLGERIRELETKIIELQETEGGQELDSITRELEVYREQIRSIRADEHSGKAKYAVAGTEYKESAADTRTYDIAERISGLSREIEECIARMGEAGNRASETARQLSEIEQRESCKRDLSFERQIIKIGGR